jgi:polysaccharide pyruvyl transferase WcaK-like protein
MMKLTIGIIDPSILSHDGLIQGSNLGDAVIMKSVDHILRELFPQATFIRVSSHLKLGRFHRSKLKECDIVFVGGSNLLGGSYFLWQRLKFVFQWKLSLLDSLSLLNKLVLFGPGWRQYNTNAGLYTRLRYSLTMSKQYFHSVRDKYTVQKLKGMGIENVSFTSCPTTWELGEYDASTIPCVKSDTVVTAVCDYKPHPKADIELFKLLKKNYKRVFLFPQSVADFEYLERHDISLDGIEIIGSSLEELAQFYSENDCDFVGARLHGGIFSLQNKKRSLIIATDNRATEIRNSINLPVVDRLDYDGIERWIQFPMPFSIKLPTEAIMAWKKQFRAIVNL